MTIGDAFPEFRRRREGPVVLGAPEDPRTVAEHHEMLRLIGAIQVGSAPLFLLAGYFLPDLLGRTDLVAQAVIGATGLLQLLVGLALVRKGREGSTRSPAALPAEAA